MSRRIRASAPGTLVLVGEHAAVYGRPALVAALDLRCEVQVEVGPGEELALELPDVGVATYLGRREVEEYSSWVRQQWEGWAQGSAASSFTALRGGNAADLVRVALGETALALGEWPDVCAVRVASAIPPSGGFGSSAALAVAVVAAVLLAAGEEASLERVEAIALEVERRQHGRPTGIDHGAVLRGGIVAVRPAGDRRPSFMHLKPAAAGLRAFNVYDTGPPAEPTGEVVADVRRRFTGKATQLDPLLDQLETVAARVEEWLVSRQARREDLIAEVRRAERCLEELGVVPTPVQAVARAVEAAGGAAKISGAGSLAGPGAGALLVIWPEALHLPPTLAACARVPCALGAPGLEVDVEEAA